MIISTKKYACETCIKGHRSSSCRHTERPLFEIKKKGRPVTQCGHCRELRKTKQVHVKCVCESKTSDLSHGTKSGFERAAFPNGVPKALEASVAFQTSTELSSSDSDHGGIGPHQCKSGDPCTCVVPRSKNRKKSHSHDLSDASRSNPVSNAAIMKRIAELRPVLPRPSEVQLSSTGVVHTLSGNHHSQRHHRSGQAPYELAYGRAHQHQLHAQSYMASSPPPSNPTFSNEQPFAQPAELTMNTGQWMTNSGNIGFDNVLFPSICGCGDDCNCPGCFHHNRGVPTSSAYGSCTNPGACGTCLDCTIMSLPTSVLPVDDTALSIPSASSQSEPVAEWLRNISSDFQYPFRQNFISDTNFEQWNQPSVPQNPTHSNVNYATPAAPGAFTNDGAFSQHDHQLDPRLLRGGFIPGGDTQLLGVPRSRSPSTSSQSSYQGSEGHGLSPSYGPNGRQHGMFVNSQGSRSASQLQGNRRVPSTTSTGSASSLPRYGS